MRIAIQSVKRAFNYGVEMGLIPSNPFKGFKAGVGGKRVTYFTDAQELAIYKFAPKPLALMVEVCIKTGARYGSEYACLTAKHVEETPSGMRWRFSPQEQKTGSKTHKERVIYVPDKLADIVREQVKKHPTGVIFPNSHGTKWKLATVKENFSRLKKKLKNNGVVLDHDACMYSTRHTYAKRMLGGYYGKPVTLDVLAGLMGNTPQVCYEHYAKWCEAYTDPLFDAVNGK
jgi:integrase